MRTSSVLPSPGTPSKQAVPADEQAGQHAVDDLVVSDDHPADLLADRRVALDELAGRFSIVSAMLIVWSCGWRIPLGCICYASGGMLSRNGSVA